MVRCSNTGVSGVIGVNGSVADPLTGEARMLVQEVLQLAKGSVIELDRLAGEPADVRVNGRLVARGEVTVVEDRVAVRLVEMVGSDQTSR